MLIVEHTSVYSRVESGSGADGWRAAHDHITDRLGDLAVIGVLDLAEITLQEPMKNDFVNYPRPAISQPGVLTNAP
jgi:hypothetical protein